jgi:hypothetical protein
MTHNSHLTKSLEAIAALGESRPACIVLSTTEPSCISCPLLNSIDYVVLGPTRSLVWSAFLRKHFAIDVKAQSRRGRVMIWSPESALLVHESTEDTLWQPWKDDVAWIEIAQLEQSMPTIQPDPSLAGVNIHNLVSNTVQQSAGGSQATKQEAPSVEISYKSDDGGEQEEGVIPLNKLHLGVLNDDLMGITPSLSRPVDSAIEV